MEPHKREFKKYILKSLDSFLVLPDFTLKGTKEDIHSFAYFLYLNSLWDEKKEFYDCNLSKKCVNALPAEKKSLHILPSITVISTVRRETKTSFPRFSVLFLT